MTPMGWREARVELVDGYAVTGADGQPTTAIEEALFRIEGGFVHLQIGDTFQVVSAPAVRRLVYAASCERRAPNNV